MGIRLGPHASGAGSNYIVPVKSTPPAPRKVGIREISGELYGPGTGGASAAHAQWRLIGIPLRGVPEIRCGIRLLWRQWERPGPLGGPNAEGALRQHQRPGPKGQSGVLAPLRRRDSCRVALKDRRVYQREEIGPWVAEGWPRTNTTKPLATFLTHGALPPHLN